MLFYDPYENVTLVCYNYSMIKKQIFTFIIRWAASSLGMYLCIALLGLATVGPESQETFQETWMLYVVAGLIFSIVNSIVKPLIKMLALPLAILTMGISTLIINTAMVVLTIYLLPGVDMTFLNAFVTSVVLSLINTVLNLFI